MKSPIRTIVVDDHPLVVTGARALIECSSDITCIGEANNGADAITLISQTEPDVSILDVSLPDMSGLELAEKVIANGYSPRVVIMTEYHDRSYIQQALHIGAKGFVQKCSAAENLLLAVRSVMLGGLFFDPLTAREMTSSSIERSSARTASLGGLGLTAREQDVLRLVALGYSNKEIGARTNISIKSIETYKARATEKLKLHSRAQIVHFALTHGWMSVN
ncbi:response regulator transcription factor [Sinorhizobium numidicum]|uniref:Response regulator transcription factor n=1 Tax=Sinorhizobium numidicum TaxID=680248 RepID=A0ABY8CSI5_9HYPH|nr:response regulator transcription factor [Sinorhizobium numidicum]WEX75608.1 response regulator transcription factor [Sinorhizobium numidicum]WEX81605.1 response regulator transcription factor [Sinorhizobium numidicum]